LIRILPQSDPFALPPSSGESGWASAETDRWLIQDISVSGSSPPESRPWAEAGKVVVVLRPEKGEGRPQGGSSECCV
jgi:hypothetical protein